GHIRQIGSREEVFSNPIDEQVATFVGVENIINGVVALNQGGIVTVNAARGVVEAVSDYAAGEGVSLCIRPEEITLAGSKASSSARNSFAGEITRVVSFGALCRVEIDCGFPLVALITKKSAEEMQLGKGKPIYASFKATGVHVLKRENR
ncbi:MAG: TOBE domain-containing protein, partial [Dehalococcoidales bacterium]|nr:TOBE domain-containing protein [Dehalococcoidales bacterium]